MSKLPQVGTTIFTVMSKMASDFGAINLAQGFPNFAIDPQLNMLLQTEANSMTHQYAPMAGSAELLHSIATMNELSYQRTFSTEAEILVTAGATQAIFTILQALVETGDEVVQLDPSYDCYAPAVILAGGKPIRVNLDPSFRPDWNQIEQAVHAKTKMLIINNPHNPAGTLWTASDYQHLVNLCRKYPQLILLADEVYEYIYFEDPFMSIKTIPELQERSICVSSFGKTHHVTGWKIGYITAAEKWMKEIKKVHQFLVFCVNHGAQQALAKYNQIADFSAIRQLYQHKRDLFAKAMQDTRFTLLPCQGSFFQLASYQAISSEKDTEFVQRLVQEKGVAAIPISVFYETPPTQHIVRFCFAKEDETLLAAAEKLRCL